MKMETKLSQFEIQNCQRWLLEAYVGLRCSISEQYMFQTSCCRESLNNFAIFLHRDLKEETPDTLGAGGYNS